jgi:hypothetical protein
MFAVEKILISMMWTIPVGFLIFVNPPQRGTWWYPDPTQWGYRSKVWLYLVMFGGTSQPTSSAAKCVGAVILALGIVVIWIIPI